MVTLGITGGIGSGKTYVARLMEHGGVPVYYTDTEARRLMNTDAGIREALTRLVGADAYLQGGGLRFHGRQSLFAGGHRAGGEAGHAHGAKKPGDKRPECVFCSAENGRKRASERKNAVCGEKNSRKRRN